MTGNLDGGAASLLEQTLRREELRVSMVVLDLRELMFIDLRRVRLIVYASIEAWLADCRLLLVRGPSQVDRVFELAAVSDVVEIAICTGPSRPSPRSCGSRPRTNRHGAGRGADKVSGEPRGAGA
jgi:anti-anti-sigma regulatory factor